jgi:glutamate carboxypeptidase|tara:strand:- start:537 stop:1679 length:1143 start_codon:yes stop_codon:yes gene_type:complete
MSEKKNTPVIDADEILRGIREWVNIESPSNDGKSVNRQVDAVEKGAAKIGAVIERIPGRDGYGDILKVRTPWGGDGPGILVLSHLDTVHPHGTIDNQNPYRREGDKVFGPGIYDMKSGAYIAYYAYQHLVRLGQETPLPITFVYVPEEEVGSPTSQVMIEIEARKSKYALVTEPARDGGKIVTARRGAMRFQIATRGRPAHSGLCHINGRSAIKEMARQIVRLEEITDYGRGVTANVGLIKGGTGCNVIPEHCSIELDVRIDNMDQAREIEVMVHAYKSFDQDVELIIEGGLNRPPYEKDKGITKLFEHAKNLASEIGFTLEDVKTGGGSDGNFTAAAGVPTLDGLGADGNGAHTHEEFIYYSSLVERTQLMLRLFETLE